MSNAAWKKWFLDTGSIVEGEASPYVTHSMKGGEDIPVNFSSNHRLLLNDWWMSGLDELSEETVELEESRSGERNSKNQALNYKGFFFF